MRIIQGTKRVLKPLVDFPTWMGYRTLIDSGKNVMESTKKIFTPANAERSESFGEAIARLGLTEKDLQRREKIFLALCLFWGLMAMGALAHGSSLLLKGGIKGGILAFALAFLAVILCFRYHFWYFQVKQRLLGATFKLWLNSLLGRKK